MRGLLVALRSDIFLALRGRTLPVFVILPAAAAVARIFQGRWTDLRRQARAALEGTTPPPEWTNAYGPFTDGVLGGLALVTLLALAAAAGGWIRDRERGTLRLALTRGVSRTAFTLGRFLSLLLLVSLSVSVVLAASAGAAGTLYEFGPIEEDGVEIYSAEEVEKEIRIGLKALALPLIAAVAFGLAVSVCARSPFGAVSTALGFWFLFELFRNELGDAQRYVYASFLPTLGSGPYLHEAAKLARGFSDFEFTEHEQWLNLIVSGTEALAFLVLALVVSSRRKM